MKLVLKKAILNHFRGVEHKEIEFDGNTKIIGENGSGKSTIASAVSWVMADTDYSLTKNPNVVPIGMPECEIKVELTFDLDGKQLEISKAQKYKEKEIDGKITSSITNTYSINSINKSFKDFTADLESRGIDIENYLIYTNPNSFLADTSKTGREKIRKILFEMASEFSDRDIAEEIDADEVVKAMDDKGYTLEEIKASAKSTISKIVAENGKQNEIINSKIDGMLSSKSEVDINVLTEQKKNYEAEIDRIEKELTDLSSGNDETSKKILELNNKKTELVAKANAEITEKRTELEKQLFEYTRTIDELAFQSQRVEREINEIAEILKEKNADIEKQRNLYKIEQDTVFDEKELSCPVCKRKYSAEKSKTIKAEFEDNKTKRLEVIKASGEELKTKIKSLESDIKGNEEKLNSLTETVKKTEKMKADIQSKLESLAATIDTKEIQLIDAEIARLGEELAKKDDTRLHELQSQKNVNKQMLNQVIGELGTVDQNKAIDDKVAALRDKRKKDEIAKANAEKVLSQVEEIEMTKNDKLAESINSNFDLVEWHLWDRQKNGNLIEVTEPYIDGKPMTSCANGSLITLAKISICESLQKVRNQRMPIWCDDASLFSKNTLERIKLDTQFIQLIVKDDVKEVQIERG